MLIYLLLLSLKFIPKYKQITLLTKCVKKGLISLRLMADSKHFTYKKLEQLSWSCSENLVQKCKIEFIVLLPYEGSMLYLLNYLAEELIVHSLLLIQLSSL